MTCFDAALHYLSLGFSIVPVKNDKTPYIAWEKYQKERATKEEVASWFKKWPKANIGIVTGQISGIAVIDIDTDESKERLAEIIPEFLEIPTALTPKGKHLYFSLDFPLSSSIRVMPGVDLKADGGYVVAPPSVINSGIYTWYLELTTTTSLIYIKTILYNIYNIYRRGGGSYPNPENRQSVNSSQNCQILSEGRRDEDLFHAANCMVKGGMQKDLAVKYLEVLAKNCNPPFPLKEVAIKVDSAIKRSEARERNIYQEIRDWVTCQDGVMNLSRCRQDCQILSKDQNNAVYQAFKRLLKEGLIEKDGKKSGQYRRVESQVEYIDITSVPETVPIDIKWPLGCESYINISPKSLAIIAGDTNAGKSAYCIQFCNLNMHKHKIYYFSSELTPQRFRDRVSKLERKIDDWKQVGFAEKASDFADVIVPDAVNIIDYMELDPGAVYEVATHLRRIFEKLTTGIAVVALQKKRGEQVAYGRDWTMQKSEFYLSLSHGEEGNIAEIIKAKNWKSDMVNPNGLKKKFLIYKGCQFWPDKEFPGWVKNFNTIEQEDF